MQFVHLVLLSNVLFLVHSGDIQFMGKANEQICIFSTLLSNGACVRDYLSAKWSVSENCMSAKSRYCCQLERDRAIYMGNTFCICGMSLQAASLSSFYCHGFESPPHFSALLNNSWIIHSPTYQTNIFATCTFRKVSRELLHNVKYHRSEIVIVIVYNLTPVSSSKQYFTVNALFLLLNFLNILMNGLHTHYNHLC